MELELKFAELACCEPVGDLVTTQEESMETAIPEYCPDIARIVDTVGQLRLREKHPAGQQLTMGGSVVLTVLYTSEESAGLRSLSMEVPFSCQVEDKRLAGCDAVCVTGRLLLAEAKAVTARKLYLRVMPEFTVSGYANRRQRLCCGTEEDPALRLRRREHELYMTAAMAERECAVAGEVTVPAGQPAPEDLLICRLYPQVASCQLVGAKLLVKGELTLCALYRCQQQKLHTYTAAVPFSQIVDSPAGGEEGDFAARVQLICGEARLLRTEESSGFSVSAELRLLLRITRKETVSCVTDLYSTHCGTKLETTERSLPLAPERPVRQEAVQHLDFGRQRPFVFVTDTACAPSAGEDGTPCADVRMRLLYLDEEDAPAVTEKMAQLPLGEGEVCTLCGAPEVAFTGSGCDLRQAVAVFRLFMQKATIYAVSAQS